MFVQDSFGWDFAVPATTGNRAHFEPFAPSPMRRWTAQNLGGCRAREHRDHARDTTKSRWKFPICRSTGAATAKDRRERFLDRPLARSGHARIEDEALGVYGLFSLLPDDASCRTGSVCNWELRQVTFPLGAGL